MSQNLLLDAMPSAVRSACLECGEPFQVNDGATMRGEDLDARHLFIITEGVASMMMRAPDGRISEIGMMGREGMFPVAALMNVPSKKGIIVAQIGDLAGVRLSSKEFHSLVAPYPEAASLVRKFTYSFIVQIATSMMSSEQDGVSRRVARWLLMSHDRTDGDAVPVTHETLAQMAFTHRPTVTNVLRDWKSQGIIDTRRGYVVVMNRAELRRLADGTYGHAEAYWCENIGPFGKDPSSCEESALSFPRAFAN